MSVPRTLAAIGRLFRRTPPPPDDVLEAYAHEVVPVLDRAEWLYQYWLEQASLFTDGEKLGNVAAIHRWETASMGRSLEKVVPPAVLANAHESVLDALDMASRAAQLLSSGSRFHNAAAVCEGQSLLTASRDRRLSAMASMRRYLSAVLDADADGPADPQAALDAGAATGRTAELTAAAAYVATDADALQRGETMSSAAPAGEAPPLTPAGQDADHPGAGGAHHDAAGTFESADAYHNADGDDHHGYADDAYHADADHHPDADYHPDNEYHEDADYHADDEYHEDADYHPDDDDDDGDALPWLTRRAEQARAVEQAADGSQSAADSQAAQPPGAIPGPSVTPVPPAAPQTTPAPAPAPDPGGWGLLFRRPPPPPHDSDTTPPRAPGD